MINEYENNLNKGLIQTLKCGIEKCSGDWIIFVESDDYISPDYIASKINALNKIPLPERNNIALVFNDIIPLYSKERHQYLDKYLSIQKKLIAEKCFKQFELMEINIIPTFSCVMARKNVLREINFQFDVPKCFDWYLWNSILIKYPALYIDKKLTTFRLHNQSYTMKKINKSVYRGLLDIGKEKYPKLKLLYFLFCLYRSNVRFEKMFRPFVRITSRFIYKNLYVQNTVKIITEKN